MAKQNAYRDSVVYTIATTPKQEQAMRNYLDTLQGVSMPNPKDGPLSALKALSDNCAVRTAGALNAGGINVGNPSFPGTLQRSMNDLMNQGGATGVNVSNAQDHGTGGNGSDANVPVNQDHGTWGNFGGVNK